jgi:nicotinamide-nucleotide amidase
VTRESVADLLGVGLRTDPELLESLEARFRSLGFETIPEESRSMASRPDTGGLLPNLRGAAPGMVLEGRNGAVCILLPGVPREMRDLFRRGVRPLVADRFGDRLSPAVHRVIHTAGIPESVLSERMEKVLPEDLGPVSLAFLPDTRGVRLRLTARTDQAPGAGEKRMDEVEELLEPVLSGYRYEAESGDLAEAVGSALASRGRTLAVAESCTGGLISKRLTDHPGSSRFFRGGVVAYHNDVKSAVLGVGWETLEAGGAVSEEVASAMALGVARLFGTDFGMGVTGVAGPQGGTPEKPLGTVWYAVSAGEKVVAKKGTFPGDREAVRERASQLALNLLLRLLEGREG